MKTKTGGVRLAQLKQSGKIDRPYLWIDTYNQLVSDIAGTVHCGVDFRNNLYVSDMADQNAIELPSELKGKKFRIRKLTPRECFRLMDMDDKYIDIIQNETTISNSNQYKLAGNSIVVSCLYYLFENLFYPPEEPQGDKYGQLSLF